MMNTSFGPTLDVAFKTEGESIRLFYLIEDKEPSTKKVANYVKNLQNAGLEVIQITGEERKDFKLDKGFQGYAVFVQKHDEDDPDFTPGTNPGYDAEETYAKIGDVWKSNFKNDVQLAPEAPKHMQNFIAQADFVIPFTPAFNGVDKVLDQMNKGTSQSSLKISAGDDLNKAKEDQIEEILLAIEEKRNNIESYNFVISSSLKNSSEAKEATGMLKKENEELNKLSEQLNDLMKS